MKNLFLAFFTTLLVGTICYSQKKELHVLKNANEVSLLVMNEKGQYIENYIFQTDNTRGFNIDNKIFTKFDIIFDKNALILKLENETFYLVVDEYIVGKNVLKGFGLSRRFGIFSMENKEGVSFFESIKEQKNQTRGSGCDSGGKGATECSVDSTVGPIATGCSVSCGAGYYACCDEGRTSCKCFKNGTGPEPAHLAPRNFQVLTNETNSSLNFIGDSFSDYFVEIYSINGKLLIEKTKLSHELPIENLNTNIYIYKIFNEKGYSQDGKFIKK